MGGFDEAGLDELIELTLGIILVVKQQRDVAAVQAEAFDEPPPLLKLVELMLFGPMYPGVVQTAGNVKR